MTQPKKVRLYPPADPNAKVGIPRTGEMFTTADARRLVGQGLASRTPPPAPAKRRRARPAREG